MTGRFRLILLTGALALLAPDPPLGAQANDRTSLVMALDSAAAAHVEHEMVAGVSVAVVRGPDTLLMEGYGFADLEWEIPTPEDGSASYEIGSVTKQFTSAAILKLVEDGKVDLDADVTDYLPDLDTQGYAVPVRRLLDHTSGIRSYTAMPVFGDLAVKKLPRDTLVSLISEEPFDFEPGTALIYNNSAYFLLGLIIEAVTDESYEDYVAETLFAPLGMDDSYYCSERAIRKNRAHGYDGTPGGLQRKSYLDHTWPYAAGSLCSTAPDLVRWNQALHGGELLSPESYRALTTPVPLEDGTPTRYAMGLGMSGSGRHRVIAHGGGINGFLSDGRYYPEEDLIIVVLQNSTGPQGPGALGAALADLVLGPTPEPEATPFEGSLDELVGSYSGRARGRDLSVEVTVDGEALVFTPDGSPNELRPVHLDGLRWAQGNTLLWFIRTEGKISELRMDQGSGHYVLRRMGG